MGLDDRRNDLQRGLTEAYREVDKLIVTLSTGLIALSGSLFGKLARPEMFWTLQTAWIFLFMAVGSVIGSLLIEQTDKRRRIRQIDFGNIETDGRTDPFINLLNIVSVSAFVVGIGAIAIFLVFNGSSSAGG